ncbi:MAG TPA: hypothetical protein PKD98_29890 [Anaerolineae bacterium]|nr:hypothetical protein [Anaerolineae bacterium]
MRDYLMLGVLAGPFVGIGLGYALDGSWQGILWGACSGMLLSGVLRRLVMREIHSEDQPTQPETGEARQKSKN